MESEPITAWGRDNDTAGLDRSIIFPSDSPKSRPNRLQTGDETFADEKIEFTMLRSDGPDLKNEKVSYRLLQKARACPEGMAGVW